MFFFKKCLQIYLIGSFRSQKWYFSQTGSESQKSEIWRFRFRYRFQTRFMGTHHPSDRFCIQKDPKPNRKCTKKLEKHIFLFLNNSGRHDAVIASWLRLDRLLYYSKLFLSVNVSKYIQFESSNPKKCILPKPEVSQKCKNWGISFKMGFKFSKSV